MTKKFTQNSIIHEDNHAAVVVDKAIRHTTCGGSKLKFGVIETIRQIKQDEKRIDLTHRLDRATSGCLVLAKNHLILKDMHKIWNSDSVRKVLTTLVSGTVPKDLTAIKTNLKVERHNKNPKKYSVKSRCR